MEGEKLLQAGFQNNPKQYSFLTMLAMHYYGLKRNQDMVEVLKQIKKDKPDLKIIIRGDEDMGYKYLEPVLITCVEAQVKNVNFNTAVERQ